MSRSQTPNRTHNRVGGDRYLELVRTVPLRPTASEAELDRAIAMIDSLLDQNKRNRAEEDYLEVLSDLVEKYEDEHDPMPPVSGAEMLRFLIESKSIPQSALEIMALEANCADAYFRAWGGIPIKWRGVKRRPIPESWHQIAARSSPFHLTGNHNAAHPVNAMLNYAYAVLESQIRIKAIPKATTNARHYASRS